MITPIRIGALEGYRDLVLELGGNPSEILSHVGIDERLWTKPDSLISTEAYRRALNMAARFTATPHFGLILSQRQSFDKLGAVGYLVKHASTLGQAIEELTYFLSTHDSGTMGELEVDGETALWSHRLTGLQEESTIQQTDLALGLTLKFLRTVVEPGWTPDALFIEHARPQSPRFYETIFRCPVYYEQPISGVEFARQELDRRLITSDPKLHQILSDHVRSIRSGHVDSFEKGVRSQIESAITASELSLASISEAMGCKSGKLQYMLHQKGLSYKSLVEDVRMKLACKYLNDTEMPLADVSMALNYAEPAVFTRAFKKNFRQTPRDFRKAARSDKFASL